MDRVFLKTIRTYFFNIIVVTLFVFWIIHQKLKKRKLEFVYSQLRIVGAERFAAIPGQYYDFSVVVVNIIIVETR